jgi:hypothetical protein
MCRRLTCNSKRECKSSKGLKKGTSQHTAFNHGFKQINKKSLFSRRAMTGICCSRAEKIQKGQLQLADQPLMLLAANSLGFEFSAMAVDPL